MLCEERVNYALYAILCEKAILIDAPDPILQRKAVKNEVEIAHARDAHLRDGVAYTRLMRYVKENAGRIPLTELSVSAKLAELRAEQDGYMGLAFNTICGYGPHAAIIHYSPTPESDAAIQPKGFLLLDAGAQYMGGTTDITRTLALGPTTAEERLHYALVLRGLLAVMNLRFLEGCTGRQLDMAARQPVWEHGLDYRHGTGHGVGFMLSVHEGPHGLNWNRPSYGCEQKAGMIESDEPGLYIAGSHGVRLENLLVCREAQRTEWGTFLGFECLTFAPLDLDALDPSLLSDREREQLNAYHREVYEKLAPRMREDERAWLANATRAV